MKLTVDKAALAAAAAIARHATAKSGVTAHMLLAVDGNGRATLSATNYDLAIDAALPGGEAGGAWLVPAEPLGRILAKLADGPVTIGGGDGRVTLAQGRSRFELVALPGVEFPEPPALVGMAAPWLWPSSDLVAALAAAHCPSADDGRPALTGVCLEVTGDDVTVAATDGHRLGVWQKPAAELEAPAGAWIVHRSALAPLAAMAATVDALEVAAGGRHLRFAAGGVSLLVRPVEAVFPAWRCVLPAPSGDTLKLTIDRKGLVAAVAKVSTLSERVDLVALMELEISALDSTLTLRTKHSLYGHAETAIEIAGVYVDRKLLLDPRLVLEALGSFTGEHVTLAIRDAVTPVLVTCDAEPANRQVLMPCKF